MCSEWAPGVVAAKKEKRLRGAARTVCGIDQKKSSLQRSRVASRFFYLLRVINDPCLF